MKLYKYLILYFLCLTMGFSSCKQDNYLMPDGGIEGSVIDATTNETIQTEQPNGIKLRLIETKYGKSVTPNDFWAKADGTFRSTFIFSGEYKVVPIEGAFFPADTAIVNVAGVAKVDFKVTPFLRIAATVVPAANSITTTYKISRTRVGGKITTARTIVSISPAVSNNVNEFSATKDLTAVADADILTTEYKETVTGLVSGVTYFVRVGAIASNPNNKYNYSKIITIKIP